MMPAPALAAAPVDSLDRFGFPTWGYTVDTLVVPQGVSLNAVFVSEGVTFDGAARLVTALGAAVKDSVRTETTTVFSRTRRGKTVRREVTRTRRLQDSRLLEKGDALYVYRDSAAVSHFVYEPTFRSYVVMKPGILPVVHEVMRPEVREERVVRAVVMPGGLAKTLAAADAPPELADSLAAVFHDRFALASVRRGDSLAVVFPEARIDTTVTDTGAVLGVRLGSGKTARYAFRFATKDGRADYYDERGQNLRNYFLDAPIRGSVVTSAYSLARFHPVLEYWKPHLGTDYAAPMGTPILAMADGTILEATFSGGNGNYVKMQHDATYTTGYLHMSRLADGMVPGRPVRQGQVIGFVGMTGLATGPHTCLRFYRGGVQVDFQRQPRLPAPGVPAAERTAFDATRDRLMARFSDVPKPLPLLATLALTDLP